MALSVFNTLTRSMEAFAPETPGRVRLYVCGPTVYDRAHLGHARSYVFYDAARRWLEATGHAVVHVQNFTDVEESVARRATAAGVAPLVWADRNIGAFLADMDALGVRRAHAYPRVSEHIPDIQALVVDLLERGLAYATDCHPGTDGGAPAEVCDVYFDVERAKDFGALVGETVEGLTVDGVVSKGLRRHALDFALWKSRPDWGVTWPSTWGDGRPGWHVECAAMALKHLGGGVDIHGGGLDLVFPHHESERVVAEAVTGRRYARYFVHNGFVTAGSEKMSKSKGNFVTVADVLARHEPAAVRAFLLGAHYRATLDYSEDALRAAGARVGAWREAAARARSRAVDAAPAPALWASFAAAADADFGFDRALAVLDEAARAPPSGGVAAFFGRAGEVLGIAL